MKPKHRTPPRWANWLLSAFGHPDTREEVEGDLLELYDHWQQTGGKRKADWRYSLSALKLLRPLGKTRSLNTYSTPFILSPHMLYNYLQIAFRHYRRHKVLGLINLSGLTLGLTCCLLIAAYVLDDLTYDRFHKNADRIVLLQQFENTPTSGGKLATDLKARFSAITNTVRLTRIKPLVAGTITKQQTGSQQTATYEPNFWFADSTVFSVFTLPLLLGNPTTALKEQYGVVLSESMARKYFGTLNVLGQSIRLNNKSTLHVTGIFKDLPTNAHVPIDFLAPYTNANELIGYDVTTNYWSGGDTWTYLLLAPNTDRSVLQAQFPAYINQLGDSNASVWKLNLVPLTDIYLRTSLVATNRLTYAYIFSIVALLILGLACFNYINLATARATQRAKEVGVRKVLGSSFSQLWSQFLGETILLMLVAVLLSVSLIYTLLPAFNNLTDKQLTITQFATGEHIGWLAASLLGVSLVAGAYPAFVLSSVQPMAVLKGSRLLIGGDIWLRKTLVIGQFAVSIGMIVATMVVYQQLLFVQNHNVGYQREQVLTLDLPDIPDQQKEVFKQQLTKLPGISAVTRAFSLPGSGRLRGEKLVSEFVPKGSQTGGINRLSIDGDFLKTFGIRLLEGRNLDPNRPADKQAFLVNRAAMTYFGWKTSSGKMTGYYTYAYGADGSYREVPIRGDVVGVIDDYNHADLKQVVAPMIVSLNNGGESQLAARIRPGAISNTLRQVEEQWHQQFPDKPFSYNFLDDTFTQTYRVESRTGQVFGLFAVLAVFISCLGLFGLATFTAEQRVKEIGIRKVLGASVYSVVSLLSKDFLKPVLLSILIATPIAWYGMSQWLQDFAYKITISGWIFALSGGLALVVALLTVSIQSLKAALMNPVKSLRNE
ncbi:ABC transporter permease [Spirosoma aerophilum]